MGIEWCPKCLKMYNPITGHDCSGVEAVHKAWEKLELWLETYTIYQSPK